MTRGLVFPSALHQGGIISASLLPTHETSGTYFASVSPLGKTGARKETHFSMLEGKPRDYFHFSPFLLVGLGSNEKTPLSGAAFKH